MSQYPPQPPNQPPPPWQGYPSQQPSQYQPQPHSGWQQPSGPQWPQQQPVPYPPAQSFQPTDPAQKIRLRIGMWIGIGLVVALIALSIVNAIISSVNASQVVKVGQTLALNGVSATLIGVGTLYYDAPPDGQPADVAVHVKLVNNSGSEISYNPLYFHLKSGAGTITGPEFIAPAMYQSNDLLGAGQLVSGGTVEGDVIFQITMGDHQAEVTWQESPTDSDSATGWMLGL